MLSGAMAGADGGTGGMAWYRLRWVLTDVAAYVAELRRPHEHGADIAASLENPTGYLGRPPARSGATAVRPHPGGRSGGDAGRPSYRKKRPQRERCGRSEDLRT